MNNELEALKVWYAVKKYMNMYHHMSIKENIDVKTVEGMPIDIIEKSLKALNIIKNKKWLVKLILSEVLHDNIDDYKLLAGVLEDDRS